MRTIKSNKSPWWWVPTLYFAEGVPYFVVNNISVIMFTRMGMPKGEMALYTSLLYLPWVIKPLWSPFVDIIKTKRWWIIATQILMSISFALLALSLPHPSAELIESSVVSISIFSISLILFWITALASATHDIAADGFYMLALNQHEQSLFVGIRSTFYRLSSLFGQGVLVVVAGLLETRLGDIPIAWKLSLVITAVLFAALTIYHSFALPKPKEDVQRHNVLTARQILDDFRKIFISFFKKKQVLVAILFMLLYRLPEALLLKMINPFLLDPISRGGLGLSTTSVGLIYGTIGIIALTLGGILGGIFASKWGLKKSLWPMALSLTLPCLCFVFLSILQPENLWLIGGCVALDQFGYGFGFTAYMLYLIYFSEGEFKTAHYSLCTAFMALSMMLPGMVAGYLQESLGYVNFFWVVMAACLVTVAVIFNIKVDPKFGKK